MQRNLSIPKISRKIWPMDKVSLCRILRKIWVINLGPSWVITVVVLPLLLGGLWWVIYAALKGPGNKTT